MSGEFTGPPGTCDALEPDLGSERLFCTGSWGEGREEPGKVSLGNEGQQIGFPYLTIK